MAFQEPDPSEDSFEEGTSGGVLKKLAPIAALSGGVLVLIFLLSLAF